MLMPNGEVCFILLFGSLEKMKIQENVQSVKQLFKMNIHFIIKFHKLKILFISKNLEEGFYEKIIEQITKEKS